MIELNPAQRRELRAEAHHLNPVVSIAGNGLTPAVMQEIERSLQAHELIKIKVHGAERDVRETFMNTICETLEASPVQHIGTILVVWRKRREETPRTAPAASDKAPSGKRTAAKAKSARAFAAAARVAAIRQSAADKKRRSTTSRSAAKPGGRSGK